jgi:NADPH:quinone reductase-like Zn-dependent oxidoreductase
LGELPTGGTLAQGGSVKAIIRDRYGSVEVLRLAETGKPVAREGEVLVRVHAAGVDQGVWHLMTGTPYAMRLAGFGIRAPKNPLLGYDVAGRVEAIGPRVTEFRPGQEVFGTCRGSFAQYAVAPPDRLLPKPDNVSFEQAASVRSQASRHCRRFAMEGSAPTSGY